MNFMNFEGPTFTMETPTNWFVTSSPQFQALFLSPPTEDPVRANFAVSMRPVEADVTIAGIVAAAKENQEREYPNYEILDEIDFTEQGGAGFLRHYRWFNKQQNTEVVQFQSYFIVAQILYTLTATRSVPTTFPELDNIFEHMTMSFRITQN